MLFCVSAAPVIACSLRSRAGIAAVTMLQPPPLPYQHNTELCSASGFSRSRFHMFSSSAQDVSWSMRSTRSTIATTVRMRGLSMRKSLMAVAALCILRTASRLQFTVGDVTRVWRPNTAASRKTGRLSVLSAHTVLGHLSNFQRTTDCRVTKRHEENHMRCGALTLSR